MPAPAGVNSLAAGGNNTSSQVLAACGNAAAAKCAESSSFALAVVVGREAGEGETGCEPPGAV